MTDLEFSALMRMKPRERLECLAARMKQPGLTPDERMHARHALHLMGRGWIGLKEDVWIEGELSPFGYREYSEIEAIERQHKLDKKQGDGRAKKLGR